MSKFPLYRQLGTADCGVACLRMVSKYYGKGISVNLLKKLSDISRVGVSFYNIGTAAESMGLKVRGLNLNLEALKSQSLLPCIVHWEQRHFVVVYKTTSNWVYVADPALGEVKYSIAEFTQGWYAGEESGMALFLQPSSAFYEMDLGVEEKNQTTHSLLRYVVTYKSYFLQLFFGLMAGSIVLLLAPFFTQVIIDTGIKNMDLHFIYVILIAQFILYLGRVTVEIFRRVILVHIGSRVYIALVSGFLSKLLNLSADFFQRHQLGDIMQRVYDHRRLEALLTVNSLNAVFSVINIALFCVVLAVYNMNIFTVFLVMSVMSILWTRLFMKKRNLLDNLSFKKHSKSIEKLYEIVKGISEIKISNSKWQKRWDWENLQGELFEINLKKDITAQWQEIGSDVLNQAKNLVITLIAAMSVVQGELSLGGMFAIIFITGQLHVPFSQLLQFTLTLNDAKLSQLRINEVHTEPEEFQPEQHYIKDFTLEPGIELKHISFRYNENMENVLNDVSFTIPFGKTTAIVGESGCGKTTLLKLLLKFIEPTTGKIVFGESDLKNIVPDDLRAKIGVVMQDGQLFTDSISNNIALGQDVYLPDIIRAARMASIDDYIQDELPMGYHTKIGGEGHVLSKGQQQRVLLARAFYKNPDILILDEATSSLDATNEKLVMNNLYAHFKNKTLIIIAHRLSTVRNADNVIVLSKKGRVTETGTHKQLIANEGQYYNLIRNQLELGA